MYMYVTGTSWKFSISRFFPPVFYERLSMIEILLTGPLNSTSKNRVRLVFLTRSSSISVRTFPTEKHFAFYKIKIKTNSAIKRPIRSRICGSLE